MKYFFLFLFSFIILISQAQSGFNRLYNLDAPSGAFTAMVSDNDTLIIMGSTYNDSISTWQLSIIKMDTLGNIIGRHDKPGPPPGPVVTWGGKIIKTNDGSYLAAFNAKNGKTIAFTKVSKNLVEEYFNILEINSIQTLIFRGMVRTGNEVIIFCEKQLSNWDIQMHAIKIDSLGNEIWQKEYGSPDDCESILDVNVNHRGEIVVNGYSFCQGSSPPVQKPWIIRVDSETGNVLWESDFPTLDTLDNSAITSALSLFCLPDDTYFLQNRENIFHYLGWRYIKHRIQHINEDGDIISSHSYGPTTSMLLLNGFGRDIIALNNGKYLSIGDVQPSTFPWENDDGYQYAGTMSVVFDGETGEEIWTRIDTSVMVDTTTNDNYWNRHILQAATLSSGSIVMAGFVQKGRAYGWLMKMDTNGCITEDDCPPGNAWLDIPDAVEEVVIDNNLLVDIFPNPAKDNLNIHYSGKYDVSLYDLYGRLITRKSGCNGSYEMDISGVQAGVYFLEVRTDKGRMTRKVVIE